ncbi:MAG: FixH family protein [Caulobacteraceae bacterium]|nr:FixH family protein [Caulobacteraceae bacterium]
MSATKSFQLNGWHVLAGLSLFFGADIAINVGYVVAAVHTFPGEVASEPYEAGVAYNRTLAQEDAERKLGWQATIEQVAPAVHGEAITVRWTDRSGRLLTGLNVKGVMRRPATEKLNTDLTFNEISPGTYRAVASAAPGGWDVSVTAMDHHGQQRTADRRLVWR